MAAGIGKIILNHRPVFFTTCWSLIVLIVYFALGKPIAFITALVLPIVFLWHFWTQTWFKPSETQTGDMTERKKRDFISLLHTKHRKGDDGRVRAQSHDVFNKPVQLNSSFDLSANLTRRTIHRPSPVTAVRRRSNLNDLNVYDSSSSSKSIIDTRTNRVIQDPYFTPSSHLSPNINAGFSYLTPNKSFASPREMSFSSSFLYSPNKYGSTNNSSIHNTSVKHYPTHQPEYSGLGQLPTVKWSGANVGSGWKKRTSMQSPVMVRIAPPDRTRSESPLIEAAKFDDTSFDYDDPCKKESVIAAIKQCRKRTVHEEEQDEGAATLPWEQTTKRRRVDESSRSSTPCSFASAYDTAPQTERSNATAADNTANGPAGGTLSHTPRNAIISSFSSAKRIKKRKNIEDGDINNKDVTPSKKLSLNLDITSNDSNQDDTMADTSISATSNKENKPESLLPVATPVKKRVDDESGSMEEDIEDRTPRKRSLRQLLAKQKTPLRGRLNKASKSMTNSPGQYTSADLAEDRHMAKQRVSYIREALKETPITSVSTKPTTAIVSTTIAGGLKPDSTIPGKPSPTPSGLLSALSKATATLPSTSGQFSLSTSTTKPSSVVPTLTLGSSIATAATSSITAQQSTDGKSSSTATGAPLKGITLQSSTAASSSAPGTGLFSVLSASKATPGAGTLGSLTATPPLHSTAATQKAAPSTLAPTFTSASLKVPPVTSTASPAAPSGLQLQQTPTSTVSLLSQQLRSQDKANSLNLATASATSKITPSTSAVSNPLTNSSPFQFGATQPIASTQGNNLSSSLFTAKPPASTATTSSGIFNTQSISAPTKEQPKTFQHLFPAAGPVASSSQTTKPTFSFSGSTGTTSASSAPSAIGTQFQSIAQNTSAAPTSKPGGFQFNASATPASSQQPQTTGSPFQFGGNSNKAPAPASTASQPSFNFGGAASQTSKPTSNTSGIFGQQTNSQNTSQTQATFGGTIKNPAPSVQTTASPFGGGGSSTGANLFGGGTTSTHTQQPQNMFGGATTQTQNPFGNSTQPQQQNAFGGGAQTQNAFGVGAQPQNAFGGGAQPQNAFGGGAQPQNAFGGTTQQPTSSAGVFAFGAGNTTKPSSANENTNAFTFGAQPTQQQTTTQASAGGAFNFATAAAPANTGFNFGQSQPAPQQQQQPSQGAPGGMFQFGMQQQSAAAAPKLTFATPAASAQPFNFSAGAAGFGSAPPSGRSTPVGPVGGFSVGAASSASSGSTAAQRRARMRQARGRSGRR